MILFENDGVVPIEAFTTFGMSAKPGTTNPIGKFGTGLKYSIAGILRLGGTVKLFRGVEEYEFYTREEDFRGKTFAKVRMRRRSSLLKRWRYESLPFTTELGKHWKPWMIVRELEANCRDENGRSMLTDAPVATKMGMNGVTRIVVDCPDVEEAYNDLDSIFLNTSTTQALYDGEHCRIFEGPSDHVFYRGMRVTDLRKPSLFTYEMKHVMLTEDRTSQYSFLDAANVTKDLMACDDKEIVNKVVREAEGHWEESFEWDRPTQKVATTWSSALSRVHLPSRFATMRDTLHYGIARDEVIELSLEVEHCETIMRALMGDHEFDEVRKMVRDQMIEAGWKEERPVLDEPVDEDAPF